jgi:hypothetical protein
MTAQIPDSFLLQDQAFSIVGVNGSGLFDPLSYNLNPLPRITSCWRGFVCTYKTLHNKLLLDILQVNLGDAGPAIHAIEPVFNPKSTFDNTYSNLHLSIDFTGGLLVAHGFLQQLYVHMGFHPAWKYETVFELVVSQGNLLETRDVSQQMAELRDRMIRRPLEPGAQSTKQELEGWVASTFKRDYKL